MASKYIPQDGASEVVGDALQDDESEGYAEVKMKEVDGFRTDTVISSEVIISEPVKQEGLVQKVWQGDVRGAAGELLKGLHKIKDPKRGACYHEFVIHARQQQPKGKLSACRVALEYLQTLATHKMIKWSAEYQFFMKMLDTNTIYIAVTGRHNVGKSTLINGLLGDDFLPMNRKNETAVRVFIKHTDDAHDPELHVKRGEESISTAAKGKASIKQYITQKNADVRRSIPQDVRLILHLKMPKLKPFSTTAVMLVDTPGFSDADRPDLEAVTNKVLRGSAAYLLMVPYTQLRDSVDLSILKHLSSLDKGVIFEGRLVIAVTQFDAYYVDSSDAEINARETVDYIYHHLKDSKHYLSKDRIIPVSGKWALLARRLKKDPGNAALLKDACRCLTAFKEAAVCGQDHVPDYYMEVRSMAPGDIAKQLEEASHIGALESQIEYVAQKCNKILEDNANSKIGGYLRQAIEELVMKRKQKKKAVKEKTTRRNEMKGHLDDFQKARKELEDRSDGTDPTVYQKLMEQYKAEAELPCANVKILMTEMLDEHNSSCLEKCRHAQQNPQKAQYSIGALKQEIEDFVGKKLTPALRQVVMNGGIHGTHQVWRLFVQMDVPKRLKKMEDALRYLPSIDSAFANTWEPPGIEIDTALEEIGKNLVLEDLMRNHKVTVPEITEWNWWDKIKAFARVLFNQRKPGDPLKASQAFAACGPNMDEVPVDDDEIDKTYRELKDAFLKRCNDYFFTDEGIQKTVVDCFYKEYTDWVKKSLDAFDIHFKPKITEEWKAVKSMEDDIQVLQNELMDLEYFVTKLQDFISRWFRV